MKNTKTQSRSISRMTNRSNLVANHSNSSASSGHTRKTWIGRQSMKPFPMKNTQNKDVQGNKLKICCWEIRRQMNGATLKNTFSLKMIISLPTPAPPPLSKHHRLVTEQKTNAFNKSPTYSRWKIDEKWKIKSCSKPNRSNVAMLPANGKER